MRRRLRHFFGYISGTGSLRHCPFKLDQWHFKSFQMSPSLFKSVQPSLRNRSRLCVDGYVTYSVISPEPEVSAIVRLNSINGISRAFKWVQVCSNRFSHLWERTHTHTYTHTHTHTHTHIHTHIHTQTFSDLVELSRMVYNTRGLRGSDQKLVFPAILYPQMFVI